MRAVKLPSRLDTEMVRRAAADNMTISELLRAALTDFLLPEVKR